MDDLDTDGAGWHQVLIIGAPYGLSHSLSCGGNFYRAAFQRNTLVHVTAEPK